ncbi:uncharacterized protein RCC_01662 [Ramularia collo-cygni]|uniref:Uncharacterized protein n=1 Tax=Ramularia collo-cygni TaxID=112498 RepID=A0A2D3UXG3_9PEZI|nr:uncharacterized protein RCC_01662 [Ramularia collo-cygni]CZT15826.1 uncharacterized protein RCC_01662 [Ramularia collo-cygni]
MEAGSLQSILATLAQFGTSTVPYPTQSTPIANFENQSAHVYPDRPNDGSTTPPGEPPGEPPAAATRLVPQQQNHLRSQTSSGNASPKPMIDPASITQWQEALRCVTKIAAQNAQFAGCIKRMMQDQKTHEMRWYTERQNLKQIQSNRCASAANAQKILSSLPAFCSPPLNDKEHKQVDKAAELAEFDRKLYAAQQAMEAGMTTEMKRLGVPFFGTDPSLILEDGRDSPVEPLPEGHPKFSPFVTETQLLMLRRKMMAHLEDLYRD